MFYDSENELKFNQVNSNHRKIYYYIPYADRTDTEYILYIYSGGHGTHVCGLAAGSSEDGVGNYDISFLK